MPVLEPRTPASLGAAVRRAVTIVFAVWAIGVILAEVVQQIAAGAAVLLALVLAFRKELRLEPDVRAYVRATMALATWQLLSPALALVTGAAERWPRGARY